MQETPALLSQDHTEAATQFYAVPEGHGPRRKTINGLERLHAEIKRRIRAVGAFPDRASALRLISLRTIGVGSFCR